MAVKGLAEANWHTQNPPPLKACGFESHLRHHQAFELKE